MELPLLNFFAIFSLLALAGLEYSKFNIITPWPAFLISTCIFSLTGYYFVPLGLSTIGQANNERVVQMADTALLINLLGVVVSVAIFYLTTSFIARSISLKEVSGISDTTSKFLSFDNVSDRKCAYAYALISLGLALALFGIMTYAQNFPLLQEDITSARPFINEYPILRPVFNFAIFATGQISTFMMLIIVLKWRDLPKITIIPFLLLIVMVLLTGNRGPLVGIPGGLVLGLSVLWLQGRSWFKVSFFAFLGYQIFFILVGSITGLIRNGAFGIFSSELLFVNPFLLFFFFFYSAYTGNSFSDLRDFSWILANFDGDFYIGKTILAGLLGFLPSFLLPFRDEYLLGKVTNKILGIPTDTHFGVRASTFGEWYINFDWIGVVMLGAILGFGYALLQYKFSEFFSDVSTRETSVFALSVLYFIPGFLDAVHDTQSYSVFYTNAILLGFVYLCSQTRRDSITTLPQPVVEQSQETVL